MVSAPPRATKPICGGARPSPRCSRSRPAAPSASRPRRRLGELGRSGGAGGSAAATLETASAQAAARRVTGPQYPIVTVSLNRDGCGREGSRLRCADARGQADRRQGRLDRASRPEPHRPALARRGRGRAAARGQFGHGAALGRDRPRPRRDPRRVPDRRAALAPHLEGRRLRRCRRPRRADPGEAARDRRPAAIPRDRAEAARGRLRRGAPRRERPRRRLGDRRGRR